MWHFIITVLAANNIACAAVQNSKALPINTSIETVNSHTDNYEQIKEDKFQAHREIQEYAEFSQNEATEEIPYSYKQFSRFLNNMDNSLIKENEITNKYQDDNILSTRLNTLENSFNIKEQYDSQTNRASWLRFKKSIPVLEPVKNLVHHVRQGNLNHTLRSQSNRHHHLLSESEMNNEENNNETSPAIETEEEREMVNESPDLQILEFLGSIGSKIWGFFSNLRQVFAASSGSASASLSASSLAGS